MLITQSIALFVLAGLFEIGGGYLVWQWWRNGSHWSVGILGAVILILYGIVPTYQPSHFGRVYAAYGGWFIILSILWGWLVDHVEPDRFRCHRGNGVLGGRDGDDVLAEIERREEEEAGLAVPLARATRGRRLPSLDART
jgi:small multidrug resistance family-3 protein